MCEAFAQQRNNSAVWFHPVEAFVAFAKILPFRGILRSETSTAGR